MSGNIVAFIMPISFAVLILVVRKYPSVDMIPLQLIAGIIAMLIGLITIGAKTTPSAMVGIIMLTEAVFGPLWAWIFANENPPFLVILGGCIIILAVFLQFFSKLEKVKKI